MAFSQGNGQGIHDGQSYKHNDLYLTLHVPGDSEGGSREDRFPLLRTVVSLGVAEPGIISWPSETWIQV